MTNNLISQQRKKIKLLTLSKLRLKSRIESNNAYLKILKSNCQILEAGEAVLRVSILAIYEVGLISFLHDKENIF